MYDLEDSDTTLTNHVLKQSSLDTCGNSLNFFQILVKKICIQFCINYSNFNLSSLIISGTI